jgi:chemotaxis protein methyltransferase CheR
VRDWGGRHDGVGYNAEVLGLTDPALTLLRDFIAQRTGVFYDDGKRDLLADKLSELVAARGLTSFLDYYYLLKYDAEAERHWGELMDRLAVPETYFWRQSEQLEALARVVAPRHFEERGGGSLRVWSAACCTGEEPLSIAIALAEAGWLDRKPIEIVASDGSAAMVERARRGLYGERAFRALPAHLREKYFRPEAGGWRAAACLRQQVRWTTANLMSQADVEPLAAAANVIFCRNVFIYFSDDAIRRVVRVFAERMPAPGHLFLGASESLTRLTTDFELAEVGGAFVYVRGNGAGPAAGAETTRRPGTFTFPEART